MRLKQYAAFGLALALAGDGMTRVRADESIDVSQIYVKRAIAEKMAPQELQAYKQRLAKRLHSGAQVARTPVRPMTPADTCPGATYEVSGLPFGPVSDTTVGATDNYQLPPDVTNPTCTASTTCTGRGLPGSLPRGSIYAGTGTGPDRAFRIRTSANCTVTLNMAPTGPQDLALILYQSTCSNSLSDCVCVSDTGGVGGAEAVTFDAIAGTDYFVVVDGYSTGGVPPGPAGAFTLGATGTGCSLVPVEVLDLQVK
jgi:hypothetical protein